MINVTLAAVAPQRRESLTVFPLVSEQSDPLPHQLLADALAADSLNVLEVGEGSVPTLVVENLAPHPVLILDGEQLLGAKQARMVNRSVVVAGRSKTEIPVSCMEQGRWHFVSEKFHGSQYHSPTRVRRKARDVEARRVRQGVEADSASLSEAQGSVWSEIEDVQASVNEYSDTRSLHDVTASMGEKVSDWSKAFPAVEGQVGLLAFLGGEPLAMDVIGSAVLYGRVHDRLMRGYIMDALSLHREDTDAPAGDVESGRAEKFLAAVHRAGRKEVPTVGVGSYFVLTSEVAGGALEQDMDGVDRMIHLMAFPAEGDPEGRGRGERVADSPIERPTRRRFMY